MNGTEENIVRCETSTKNNGSKNKKDYQKRKLPQKCHVETHFQKNNKRREKKKTGTNGTEQTGTKATSTAECTDTSRELEELDLAQPRALKCQDPSSNSSETANGRKVDRR